MFLNGDIDDDGSQPEGVPSRVWAITAGACTLPIYLAFSHFGMVGKGTAAMIAAGTMILAIKLHSQFMKQFWFWGVILLAAVVNALLVAYIPFPNKDYSFAIVAPFGYADYYLISAFIRLTEKRVPRSS